MSANFEVTLPRMLEQQLGRYLGIHGREGISSFEILDVLLDIFLEATNTSIPWNRKASLLIFLVKSVTKDEKDRRNFKFIGKSAELVAKIGQDEAQIIAAIECWLAAKKAKSLG